MAALDFARYEASALPGEEEGGAGGCGAATNYARFIRGEGGSESSSTTTSALSGDESEGSEEVRAQEAAALEQWGVGAHAGGALASGAVQEGVQMIEESEWTPRLAVLDLDWDTVRAVDLLAIFRSFLPPGGRLKRVAVLPSKFGLERMAQEELHGPQGAWKKRASKGEGRGGRGAAAAAVREDSFDDDSDNVSESDASSSEEGSAEARERLRSYERSRLRYFFALVETDSVKTAGALYEACDGLELGPGVSSAALDLRFVPDGQGFTQAPRDEATEVPEGYAGVGSGMATSVSALRHTRVGLSWDAGDPRRRAALKAGAGGDEGDLQAYLASASEEEAEGERGSAESDSEEGAAQRSRRSKLARILQEAAGGRSGAGGKSWGKARDVDMQVTFGGGFVDSEEEEKQEAEFEEDQARSGKKKVKNTRQAEEKQRGRGAERDFVEGDAAAAEADLGFDDPFFSGGGGGRPSGETEEGRGKKKTKKHGALSKEDREEDRRKQAELELLMMDDGALLHGGAGRGGGEEEDSDGEEARRAARTGRKKRRSDGRREKARGPAEEEDAGGVDLDDPRFNKLFESHHFALDPTDPNFKATAGSRSIQKRARERRGRQERAGARAAEEAEAPDAAGRADPIASMVTSLKRKLGRR